MKKIFLLSFLGFAFSITHLQAQFTGKKFISGDAAIGFGVNNPEESKATNGYSYGINVGFGKFKTETRASGWNLSTSLAGRKEYITINNSPTAIDGIRGVGFGVGHFWQFYKHFNDNFGIYGGPDIGLNYDYSKNVTSNGSESFDVKTHGISVALGISAGAYYKLNERWWLLGSLGFAQPVALKYTLMHSSNRLSDDENITHDFVYGFAPGITFPSVSLGLRYFLRD